MYYFSCYRSYSPILCHDNILLFVCKLSESWCVIGNKPITFSVVFISGRPLIQVFPLFYAACDQLGAPTICGISCRLVFL